MDDFLERISAYRPDLLRHCYRMLGSFADAEDLVQDSLLRAWNGRDSYANQAPLVHWLMRIATNACLNELVARHRRGLPQLDHPAAVGMVPLEERRVCEWVTPAPDAKLFGEPARQLEERESVALAFLALLQRLSPRQRAVFLLKEVLDWSVAEIGAALDMTVGSVSSALHRARATITAPVSPRGSEPTTETLQAYVRSWEQRDVSAMVALMRDDISFAMPPYSTWFRGRVNVERFLRGPELGARWSAGFRVLTTRTNGELGLAFYRGDGTAYVASSLQVVRFVDDRLAEIVAFLGPESLRGFELPERLEFNLRSPRPA